MGAFDWTKLRIEPGAWLGKTVVLQGWIDIHWGASTKVADVFLYESRDALQYGLERRAVEVSLPGFLEAMAVQGVKEEAMAAMLNGKCVSVAGVLGETSGTSILGILNGDIKISLIDEWKQEMLRNLNKK